MLQNPKKQRPFYDEEVKRRQERRAAEKAWARQRKGAQTPSGEKGVKVPQDGEFVPTEGGPDPLCVDVGYYARRVGLDVEIFDVQTEDGFIIELWHIFTPREYTQRPSADRRMHGPNTFETSPIDSGFADTQPFPETNKKYPVLMIHGLLQSAGAFCCNDDDSLAFYLAKSGYDVWLGNNRCGFHPRHTLLDHKDPRMWAWNIRQMGVLDLPALISRVLAETGFPKLALIAHSQGTTETFVALAKEQRPDMGEKISVFCALAPAAYAGPLIGKIYFKVMRVISPATFRIIFGIHAFIPLMMFAHRILPARPYSWMAYHVFSYLFSWSDSRWERGLRNRMFQWAPVYVSAESMRWWLGRECFAKQKCILATREEGKLEDKEDEEDDEVIRKATMDREPHLNPRRKLQRNLSSFHCPTEEHVHHDSRRGRFAWYNEQFPPLALWVAGSDGLVDGRRLLRRFDRGREPHVKIVHKKIIEEYEHLDVIWAMDAIEKVGKEVREVIWRTVDPETALMCRVPTGCSKPLEEDPDIADDVPMMHSGGRLRMASISEGVPPPFVANMRFEQSAGEPSHDHMETAVETEAEYDFDEEKTGVFDRRLSEVPFTDVQEKGNPLA
jgi:pimeloyl-ACP methyl ester carboxylesterase